MKKITLIILCAAICGTGYAQIPLPYTSGFDNATEQAGWQKFRKGNTSIPHEWEIKPACQGAPSAPNCVSHDYPVGGATTKVVDWFVSPQFDFSGGGKVDEVMINVYAIMGSADPDDHFGIYLLNGSADPATATVTMLADLTSNASSSGNWNKVTNYTIPPTAGASYIGFKYTAMNNWFVPAFDNLKLSGNGTPAPCAATASLTVSNIKSVSAQLNWQQVGGATGYEYATTTGATPPATGTGSTQLQVNATGLSSGTNYYAHVRAKCGTVFSAWKSTPFFTQFPASIYNNAQEYITAYPNPVQDAIHVKGLSKGMMVQLTDVTGKVWATRQADDSYMQLPATSLPKGLFIVHVTGASVSYKTMLVRN